MQLESDPGVCTFANCAIRIWTSLTVATSVLCHCLQLRPCPPKHHHHHHLFLPLLFVSNVPHSLLNLGCQEPIPPYVKERSLLPLSQDQWFPNCEWAIETSQGSNRILRETHQIVSGRCECSQKIWEPLPKTEAGPLRYPTHAQTNGAVMPCLTF